MPKYHYARQVSQRKIFSGVYEFALPWSRAEGVKQSIVGVVTKKTGHGECTGIDSLDFSFHNPATLVDVKKSLNII